jgi:presenilin-like A22 family membrane protease
LVAGLHGNIIVAMGTLVGALVGFALLMRYVLKGNPQAGLPLLNGGAIVGYLVTYLLVFEDLSFGITLAW